MVFLSYLTSILKLLMSVQFSENNMFREVTEQQWGMESCYDTVPRKKYHIYKTAYRLCVPAILPPPRSLLVTSR